MALKKCKECGHKVSTKADKCPNCGVKDPTTGAATKILSVIIALFFLGWLCSNLGDIGGDSSSKTASNDTIKQEQNIDWEPVLNAVDKARETGFLTRVDKVGRTFYVSQFIWQSVDATTKENSVIIFASYMGYLNDMDSEVGVTVKDNQSGKTLATYGTWSGVEIK